jgi:hypothetical protein
MKGRILFANRTHTIDCTVRNLSETGAQVVVSGSAPMPFSFELEIPAAAVCVAARVAWSRDNTYGLSFPNGPHPQLGSIGYTLTASLEHMPADLKPGTQDLLERVRHEIAEIEGVAPEFVRMRVEVER